MAENDALVWMMAGLIGAAFSQNIKTYWNSDRVYDAKCSTYSGQVRELRQVWTEPSSFVDVATGKKVLFTGSCTFVAVDEAPEAPPKAAAVAAPTPVREVPPAKVVCVEDLRPGYVGRVQRTSERKAAEWSAEGTAKVVRCP